MLAGLSHSRIFPGRLSVLEDGQQLGRLSDTVLVLVGRQAMCIPVHRRLFFGLGSAGCALGREF